MKLILFTFVATLISFVFGNCPRIPNGIYTAKTKGGGGFRISIGFDPQRFISGNMYTVSISGNRSFKKFLLTVERNGSSTSNSNDNANPQYVGNLMLVSESKTVYSENCVNTIVEKDDSEKHQIDVIWKAPLSSSDRNNCISIKAMVVEDEKNWFADEEDLTKTLCEYVEETVPQPSKCCACDDAHYKVIFEGLWSKKTHPKDFPSLLALTHFSDIIGGTHHNNFRFWGEGMIASDGLKQLAEWGSVGSLEKELLENKRHLKTVIKAGGLWYPNVNTNTSSSFRVDRSKHLVSVVSMFGPSPDWIVGVSGLDLCQSDCSWMRERIIDLYPYDAGTDNGVTYMSPNSPTIPREKIRKITSFYPEDPRAPFYDPAGKEMNPLARLYIFRSKTIKKACDAKTEDELLEEVSITDNDEDSDRSECSVTEYSKWSQCNVSCGKGLRMRQRSYINENAANKAGCSRQLISKEMCVANSPTCPGDEPELPLDFVEKNCKVKPWSSWSSCSVTCGLGIKMRTRQFVDKLSHKQCINVNTEEKDKCMMPPCQKEEIPDPLCPTTEWSEWSPCSVSCGTGLSIRTRDYLVSESMKEKCKTRVQRTQQFSCSQEDCAFDLNIAKEVCILDEDRGPCRGALVERWRYEHRKGMCIPFLYGGCRGNRNNFATDTECLAQCSGLRNVNLSLNTTTNDLKPQDCVVSEWSSWSACSSSCGRGVITKTRQILVDTRNGGTLCPKLVMKRICFKKC